MPGLGTRSILCAWVLLGSLSLACDRGETPPPSPTTATDTKGTATTMPLTPPLPIRSPIALEDIATYPLPGTSHPGSLAFSPDDRWLTWLDSPDDTLVRELFAQDLETKSIVHAVEPPGGGESEENLSPEEKLARERLRQRALGVTRYAWAKHGDHMLVPLSGEVWVKAGVATAGELRKLVGKDAEGRPALDPKLSPDGSQVAFVQGDELWVVPFDGSATPRALTRGGAAQGLVRGLAEYAAAEEMDRHDGFWWSPDGEHIAFAEVDERGLVDYRIVHQGKPEVGGLAQEDHRYPFAGTRNAKVRLGVVDLAGGSPRYVDLVQSDWAARSEVEVEGKRVPAPWTDDPTHDYYLARVQWRPDGTLLAQVTDRRQLELRLLAFELPAKGAIAPARELLRETSDVWINLHHLLRPLELDEATAAAHPEQLGAFVWASEKTGYRHLYLHGADGRELVALTSGAWMVDDVAGVCEATQKLYFTAGKDDPRQRQLYEVGLDGQGLRAVTSEPGMHGVVLDHACTRFVDVHASRQQPATIKLRSLADGSTLHVIHDREPEVDAKIAKLELAPPELVELVADDGTTKLYGALHRPDPGVFGPGPYPTVVSVYGGPHAQRVDDSWGMTIDLRAQYLADHGYLVFKLDNRGSARRGLAFEGALRHDMGNVEVRDQVSGVKWLVEQGLADPKRVAIYGWSYGGYMAAMALARAPETFQLAIAGAPVSSWDGYDTHYTERYMGLPQENPEGYARSSVMAHVEGMRGKLLLVHGLIDENVHFRHSARLINAMIAAGKDYDLQLYPDERHMPRKLADRVYMERRIFDYLEAHL